MRPLAPLGLVALCLLFAIPAFAFDLKTRGHVPANVRAPKAQLALIQCDNGNATSAFFQDDGVRYGNNFDFGLGSTLSSLEIAHFGFGFPGPYNFDIELYDDATCTLIGEANGLVASDAAGDAVLEEYNTCPYNLVGVGSVHVTIDANSCLEPEDCYPDILFDDQSPTCQIIVQPSTNTCVQSSNGGNFLLRIGLNDCLTPTKKITWGSLKQLYR